MSTDVSELEEVPADLISKASVTETIVFQSLSPDLESFVYILNDLLVAYQF